ncbi:MAG: flavodoxin [Bacteroidetes bacterium]|nr:MAG: flavodoxin [Bacteroidota bacterium]
MKKTAIFYGSTSGTAEDIAKKIGTTLGADTFDVADSPLDEVANYENLIIGSSTTGIGDLQEDWEDFVTDFEEADLNGKTIAIFGVGNGVSFSDSFVGCMEKLYDAVKDKGCKIVGFTDTEGYEYDDSPSIVDGKFVGLPIDEDNQDELTDERIEKWVEILKPHL